MTREKLMKIFAHVQGEILAYKGVLIGLQYETTDVPTLQRLGVIPAINPAEYANMSHFTMAHSVELLFQAIQEKEELEKSIRKYRDEIRVRSLMGILEDVYPDV